MGLMRAPSVVYGFGFYIPCPYFGLGIERIQSRREASHERSIHSFSFVAATAGFASLSVGQVILQEDMNNLCRIHQRERERDLC